MTCNQTEQLHAYHDGELSPAEAAAMGQHVQSCPACSAELTGLRELSKAFARVESPRLSQISRARLHRNLDAVIERGLVRFAWSLSGVAAAVLLVGSIWLAQSPEPVQAAPPWVDAVVYAHPLGNRAETPAAQWYLADATQRNGDETP